MSTELIAAIIRMISAGFFAACAFTFFYGLARTDFKTQNPEIWAMAMALLALACLVSGSWIVLIILR